MDKGEWQTAIETVKPYVVKILTPQGTGTGFLVSFPKDRRLFGVATAAHVVNHAHLWEEPIRLHHVGSGETVVLHHADRAIFLEENLDTAAVVFQNQSIKWPEKALELIPVAVNLKIGNEVGWLGFPAISPANLCFFTGVASCWLENDRAYLVDGVAINGVSGGPAFHVAMDGVLRVIGVVSAYIPNRATGEPLPGLCVVRDVKQFQELSQRFATVGEAKRQESEPIAPAVSEPAPQAGPPATPQPES
jgi:hypothetical protein